MVFSFTVDFIFIIQLSANFYENLSNEASSCRIKYRSCSIFFFSLILFTPSMFSTSSLVDICRFEKHSWQVARALDAKQTSSIGARPTTNPKIRYTSTWREASRLISIIIFLRAVVIALRRCCMCFTLNLISWNCSIGVCFTSSLLPVSLLPICKCFVRYIAFNAPAKYTPRTYISFDEWHEERKRGNWREKRKILSQKTKIVYLLSRGKLWNISFCFFISTFYMCARVRVAQNIIEFSRSPVEQWRRVAFELFSLFFCVLLILTN